MIPSFKCSQNNKCSRICVNKQCKSPALLCSDDDCPCSQKKHFKCIFQGAPFLLNGIYDRGQDKSRQDEDSFREIMNIFNEMTQKLFFIQQEFQKEFNNFGVPPSCLEFKQITKKGQFHKITGALCLKIRQEIEEDENLGKLCLPSTQEINQFWVERIETFDNFLNSLSEITIPKRKIMSTIASNIIKTIEQEKILRQFFDQPFGKLEKIFTASQNNFSIEQFHNKCDRLQNTVLLLQTEFGKKIGAYITVPWFAQSQGQVQDLSKKSFMFSISLKEKYQMIKDTAIYFSSECGPVIGGGDGADLYIADCCNTVQSTTDFPLCFNNGKYIRKDQASYTALTGQINNNKFKVKQYEVFSLK